MKKLTNIQTQRVASQRGLFDLSAWLNCVDYLFVTRTDDDPADAVIWNQTMQLVRIFIDGALHVASSHMPELGYECLLMASCKELSGPPVAHALTEDRCVFTGRFKPPLYRSPSHKEPISVCERVQCRFQWWAHHTITGLECPHTSSWYVFESQFTMLVLAVHMLGHLPAILKQHAKSILPGATGDEFRKDPLWGELYLRINSAMFIVHQQTGV